MSRNTIFNHFPPLLNSFFDRMKSAPRRVLMLDYDGTLAPFRIAREQATPYPGVREILSQILQAGHTRLIIVSGRRTHEVITLLRLAEPLEVWGAHGWELCRADGTWRVYRIGAHALEVISCVRQWLLDQVLAEQIEIKPGGLALHWRGFPPETGKQLNKAIRKEWARPALKAGLELLDFDGGVELRVHGRHKGSVVQSVLEALPQGSSVAYLGDDRTDEDAFAALRGRGLSILVREIYRPTIAQAWIRPPDELLSFLHHWHQTATLHPPSALDEIRQGKAPSHRSLSNNIFAG